MSFAHAEIAQSNNIYFKQRNPSFFLHSLCIYRISILLFLPHYQNSFQVEACKNINLLTSAKMLQTVQVKPLLDPQVAEFHVEHPQAPALPYPHRQADTGEFLVVSPYTSLPHLLDLRALDLAQQLLAKSLTILEAMRLDYATAPYDISFNWDATFAKLKFLARQQRFSWKRQHFCTFL